MRTKQSRSRSYFGKCSDTFIPLGECLRLHRHDSPPCNASPFSGYSTWSRFLHEESPRHRQQNPYFCASSHCVRGYHGGEARAHEHRNRALVDVSYDLNYLYADHGGCSRRGLHRTTASALKNFLLRTDTQKKPRVNPNGDRSSPPPQTLVVRVRKFSLPGLGSRGDKPLRLPFPFPKSRQGSGR
jgi:hypothetical protein